jgi:hypothetical protein
MQPVWAKTVFWSAVIHGAYVIVAKAIKIIRPFMSRISAVDFVLYSLVEPFVNEGWLWFFCIPSVVFSV